MLAVSPLQQLLGQLRVGQVQNPRLVSPNTGLSPYLPGLTPASPTSVGAWASHDYTDSNGLPMHMPAYNGHGFTPTPLARPMQIPQLPSFNRLRAL